MAILKEYVEIVELYKEEPTKIYLPNVKDMYVIDNTEVDGLDEVTEEYCKIETKDGKSFHFNDTLILALEKGHEDADKIKSKYSDIITDYKLI